MFDALHAIARAIPYQHAVVRLAHIIAESHARNNGHPDPYRYAYAHEGRHLAEAAEVFLVLTDPRTYEGRQLRLDVLNFKIERGLLYAIPIPTSHRA